MLLDPSPKTQLARLAFTELLVKTVLCGKHMAVKSGSKAAVTFGYTVTVSRQVEAQLCLLNTVRLISFLRELNW